MKQRVSDLALSSLRGWHNIAIYEEELLSTAISVRHVYVALHQWKLQCYCGDRSAASSSFNSNLVASILEKRLCSYLTLLS